MPELPEVADALRRIRRHLIGRRLTALRTTHTATARLLPATARRRVVGRHIVRVERRGKYQLLHLDDGAILVAHFRMTGQWDAVRPGAPLPAHARVILVFDDGSRVALVDPRVLGGITYHPPDRPPTLDLGVEPLSRQFTPARLGSLLAGRRGPLKTVLLDQRVIAGLGNIYVAEALWVARLDPRRAANTLTAREVVRLRAAIVEVLRTAPRGRYWERDADGAAWRVYDRLGEPCDRCQTPIARFQQGGRSTYWCPRCPTTMRD